MLRPYHVCPPRAVRVLRRSRVQEAALASQFLVEKMGHRGFVMKHLFASILTLAACGGDPLDPGAGNALGEGTNTLFVDGRAHAEPRFDNAKTETDFTTEFSIRIALNDQAVTTGTVTVASRFGKTPLVWQADGAFGHWVGTM